MHAVKSRARQCAWYHREGDPQVYNPFGKVRSHDRFDSRDTERGFNRHLSESNVQDRMQEKRLAPSDGPERQVPSASTFPRDPHKFDNGSPIEQPEGKRSEQSESQGIETIASTREATEDKPKPRNRFLAKFVKKSAVESEVDESLEERKVRQPHYTFANQIQATLFNSWINVLLIAVPVGIIVNYLKIAPVAIFVINFIAIIPLAALLSYATEEIALRVGETLGGLLNATFGNAVELIVSIIALFQDEIVIVQTSLIGSMLSNLLLVMGMAFFCGGLNRIEQFFNVTVAQTAASLLALAIGSLVIPTAFHKFADVENDEGQIRKLSRGTAIILLVIYGCYLFFQLKTHTSMYNEPSQKGVDRNKAKGAAHQGIAQIGAGMASTVGGKQGQDVGYKVEDAEIEVPQLSVLTAILTLAGSTALVGLCAEFMVSSIDAVTETSGISKTFVGLILVPIVGNAAEHATAVTVAIKDKMDLALGVCLGSSLQIALFVLPFIVIIGWIGDKNDMTLSFDAFQVIVLFVAVLLVNYLIQDGKSH
ncbi:MAG: hypothetical protein M1825_005649, partial [Sarcosagium campestre]